MNEDSCPHWSLSTYRIAHYDFLYFGIQRRQAGYLIVVAAVVAFVMKRFDTHPLMSLVVSLGASVLTFLLLVVLNRSDPHWLENATSHKFPDTFYYGDKS